MIPIKVQIDPPATAQVNMSTDEGLFALAEQGTPGITIRFYSWSELAISFGYRQSFELVDQKKAKQFEISLVRRITGGGMVFHQPNELTYCLVAENRLFPESIIQSCNSISNIFITGLKKLGVTAELAGRKGTAICNDALCFARPTKYEVLVNGRKLIGSAQKRGRIAFVQHGSLAINNLDPLFAKLTDCSEVKQQQTSLENILSKKYDYQKIAELLSSEFKQLTSS